MNPRIATPDDNDQLVSIMEHPAIKPWVSHDGARSFNPDDYTRHPKSFAVMVEGGCFLVYALEQSSYCVHTNLLPGFRGFKAIQAARKAFELVYLGTDAEQIWTMVPKCNPQAGWFAGAMGFRKQFERAQVWPHAGRKHDMAYFRQDVDDWIQAGHTAPLGELFHSARAEQGAEPNHASDRVHDSYAGAAWGMFGCRQFEKGARIYNRWGRVAGFQPLTVLSTDPLRVDIHDCIVSADGASFAVERKANA